jgi:hypothetical protein
MGAFNSSDNECVWKRAAAAASNLQTAQRFDETSNFYYIFINFLDTEATTNFKHLQWIFSQTPKRQHPT